MMKIPVNRMMLVEFVKVQRFQSLPDDFNSTQFTIE